MFEEDQKLRVPDPDEAEATEESHGEIFVLAAAVSLLAGLAFFLDRYEAAHAPEETTEREAATGAPEGPSRDVPLADRADRLAAYTENEGLDDYRWRSRDVLASLRHGPRRIAVRACRAAFRDRPDELLSGEIRGELLRIVDRRAEHVPWSCLYRVFFSERDRLQASVVDELAGIWERISSFDGASHIASRIGYGFAAETFLPEAPAFRRWARLCALNFDRPEGYGCRRLLAEVAPQQGADLLDLAEVHLRETDLNPTFDLPILVSGLRYLAARGQPPGWRIEETDALADYDTDLRLAAIFYLCRFVQSPTDSVATAAAGALSEVAGYGVRAGDEKMRRRWLSACRMAFGDKADETSEEAGEPAAGSVPALAVWSGEEDESPQYALQATIDRGDCRVRPDHPRWYCGSAKFRGTSPDELTDYFVETRHLEWDSAPLELH